MIFAEGLENSMKKSLQILVGATLAIYLSGALLVEANEKRPKISRIDGGKVGWIGWDSYDCEADWKAECEHTWTIAPPKLGVYCVHRVDVESINEARYQITVNEDSTITVKTKVVSGYFADRWRGWLKFRIVIGYVGRRTLRNNDGACLPVDYAWASRGKGNDHRIATIVPENCWDPSSVVLNEECLFWERFSKNHRAPRIDGYDDYIKDRNKRQN